MATSSMRRKTGHTASVALTAKPVEVIPKTKVIRRLVAVEPVVVALVIATIDTNKKPVATATGFFVYKILGCVAVDFLVY